MAINPDQLKGGAKVRVKSGKTYIVHTAYQSDQPDWARNFVGLIKDGHTVGDGQVEWGHGVYNIDRTAVHATQWQVNEKHPEGRFYQASRLLKLSEIDLI